LRKKSMNRTMLKLLCGSVALFACRAAVAYDDGDWQFWNTDSVETKINDRLKTKLETEFYWGDDMSDFYYAHVDLGVYGKVVPWFELGANCRYVREKKQEEWRDEYRPHLNGTFLWAMGPLAMSDRNTACARRQTRAGGIGTDCGQVGRPSGHVSKSSLTWTTKFFMILS
jgi:hypothetical protein